MADSDYLEVEVSGLGPGQKRPLVHAGLEILLCNVDGVYYAIENVCSHAAVPLSEGVLDGCELECEFHGAVFDVRDGRAVALPATSSLRTFPVERVGLDDLRVRIHL
jgi:3-phenylpropionate/trans-cinnamate dioxygenase ferredoxin subunit